MNFMFIPSSHIIYKSTENKIKLSGRHVHTLPQDQQLSVGTVCGKTSLSVDHQICPLINIDP